MRVTEILHHKGRTMYTARTTETVAAAVHRLAEHNIGALLVYDRWGRYAGLFTERHLVHRLEQHGEMAVDLPVGEVMTPDRVTCRPDDPIRKALAVMTAHRIRHMPVAEDGGTIVGIVSIGDLVRGLLEEKQLEIDVLRDMARSH
jgi:CBS domain-containing protein